MRISKSLLILLLCSLSACVYAQIGMRELGDSLMAYTGFSRVWAPAVHVKSLRVNGNTITLRTNTTLRDYRWTDASIAELKRKVSLWVLGNESGKVTILSAGTNIETLVTACARHQTTVSTPDKKRNRDLTERTIALWPSHGLYYNISRDEWIWQRATLWTTVEDLYSQEYVRLIRAMLDNAGATVLMPRAGLEQQQPGISGMPQWTEGARYWLVNQRTDSAVWNLYDQDHYKDDMKCRPMWVNAQETPVDLCLAFHTDGADSGNDTTIIGTLAIYTAHDDEGRTTLRDGRNRELTNRNLADWIQTQVTEDLRHIAPEWTRRQLREANYCESRVPVVPSMILELLSHKNMADMRYGLNPAFRFAAARAVYKGILRYLNGSAAIVQPLPVEQLSISKDGILRWETSIDSIEPTATPTYYMVYTRQDDGEWNVQQVEHATELALTLQRGVRYSFYVVAGNEGGLSMPGPTISAYLSEREESPMALIVDGFNDTYGPEWFADSTFAGIVPGSYACEDRFSCAYIGAQWDYRRTSQWINDDNCGWGACYRDHAGQLIVGNTRNWAVQHGRQLRRMRISYTSCTAGMLSQSMISDSTITILDYVCGRQRQPLPEMQRNILTTYLNHGGRLLLSTDHFCAIEPAWAKQYLNASYYAAQASRSGRITSPMHRLYQLVLEPNEEQLFSPAPQALKAEGKEAIRMAEYTDMRCPAAIGVPQKTLVYGFPLEACYDFDKIYRHSIEWLLQ